LLNNYAEAITDFTKVIELNPNAADAYYFRGYSKMKLGKRRSALDDYRKAKELGIKKGSKRIPDKNLSDIHSQLNSFYKILIP